MEKLGTVGSTLIHVGEKLGIPALDPGRIFVTGGTSVVGYRATKKILQAGHNKVRFGCHYSSRQSGLKLESNGQLVSELNFLGGEFVDFRWSDEATYTSALKGVQTVFCTGKVENQNVERIASQSSAENANCLCDRGGTWNHFAGCVLAVSTGQSSRSLHLLSGRLISCQEM